MQDVTDQPEVFRLPPPAPFSETMLTPEQLDADRRARSARVAQAIAERQAEEAQETERLERGRRERAQAAMVQREGGWLARHLAAGGSEAEWPAVRDELRRRFLAEQAAGPSAVEQHQAALKATGLFSRM